MSVPPRTTPGAVQGIMMGSSLASIYDQETDLTPYIEAASITVDQLSRAASARAAQGDTIGLCTLGAAQLEMIERVLSAYNYTHLDPLLQQKSTSGASGSVVTSQTLDAEQNRLKRWAIELDTSGCLNAILNRKFARTTWLGKPPISQVPAWQRGW